jgi:hypothetical protein
MRFTPPPQMLLLPLFEPDAIIFAFSLFAEFLRRATPRFPFIACSECQSPPTGLRHAGITTDQTHAEQAVPAVQQPHSQRYKQNVPQKEEGDSPARWFTPSIHKHATSLLFFLCRQPARQNVTINGAMLWL